MIKTSSVSFSYGATHFNFPDISCEQRDALLITGASGKGKTTMLHLLGGLLRPQSGSIVVGDTNIAKLSERKLDHFRGQHIGIVLQESHFVESLNVIDNVILSSWLANGKRSKEKAEKILDQLGLASQSHKHPSKLSIGQQQRVSIARALINDPKLLLADEPTSSLDDENTVIVAELLSKLSQEHGSALIIVTHDQRLKNHFRKSVSI